MSDNNETRTVFHPIAEAIKDIRNGKMIVVVDDESRENEGDLIMAAEKVDAESINFIAKHARGLICVALLGERLDKLRLGDIFDKIRDIYVDLKNIENG